MIDLNEYYTYERWTCLIEGKDTYWCNLKGRTVKVTVTYKRYNFKNMDLTIATFFDWNRNLTVWKYWKEWKKNMILKVSWAILRLMLLIWI